MPNFYLLLLLACQPLFVFSQEVPCAWRDADGAWHKGITKPLDMLLEHNQQLMLKNEAGRWERHLPTPSFASYALAGDTFDVCQLGQGYVFGKRVVSGPLPLYMVDEMALDKVLREQDLPNPLSVLATNAERASSKEFESAYDTPIPLLIWPESGRYLVINPRPAGEAQAALKAALHDFSGPWPALAAGKQRLATAYTVDIMQRYNRQLAIKQQKLAEEMAKKSGF